MATDMRPEEFVERTLDACAWLMPLAEASRDQYGWPPQVASWLDQLASRLHEGGLPVPEEPGSWRRGDCAHLWGKRSCFGCGRPL